MTPLELMIAEGRWYAENGTHLNEKRITLCPGCRTKDGKVPHLEYFRQLAPPAYMHRPQHVVGDFILKSCAPDKRHRLLGVRRVITKESKQEL